jgi:hypothetical protein
MKESRLSLALKHTAVGPPVQFSGFEVMENREYNGER